MLADEIKEYRGKHQLTQPQFAKMCGISVITVMHIEQGRLPSVLTQGKIRNVIDKEANVNAGEN